MSSVVNVLCNPFELVIEAYENLYQSPCDVEFTYGINKTGKGPWGQTVFPADGSKPIVAVDITTPFQHTVEILAHELAHVAVGQNCKTEHGPEWEASFEAINQEYLRLYKDRYGITGDTLHEDGLPPGTYGYAKRQLNRTVSDLLKTIIESVKSGLNKS